MKRPALRIPSALAFAVLGATSATSLVASCKDDPPPSDANDDKDAAIDSGFCPRACEAEGGGGPCQAQPCIDQNGACPAGCQPEPAKYFCVPDGTDAGVCPEPPPCIAEGELCPPGCTPVG